MSQWVRPRLSVCLIARDEARHLPGCLESVRDWADEIVLLDTGSTDATVDIARLAGVRVFSGDWQGDFSLARNACLGRARGDWILSLDADERLDYINGARLLRLIAEAPREIDAFQLRIVSAADSLHSGVELVHFYPRLFRRAEDIRFRGALHEQIYRGDVPLGPRAPKTPLSIYHVGYADGEKNRARLGRNHGIALDEASGRPEDPSARLKLADTLVMVGEMDRAMSIYLELLDGEQLGELKANVRWNLAVCRFKAGRLEEALAELDRAVEEFPLLTGTRFMRAQLLMEAGRPGEALPHIEALLAREAHDPLMTDIRPQPAFVLTLKGICLASEGRPSEALEAYDQAIGRDSQLHAAHAHRGDLLMTLGRPDEALVSYLRASALRPDQGRVRLKAGLVLLDRGRREDGLAMIRESARLDPSIAPEVRRIEEALDIIPPPAKPPAEEVPAGGSELATIPAASEPMAEEAPAAAPESMDIHTESAPVDTPVESEPVIIPAAPEQKAITHLGDATPSPVMDPHDSPPESSPEPELDIELPAAPAAGMAAPKISVCLIVRNEAERLPGCLRSVSGLAAEIIVCDTGSTDGTVETARSLGARVVHFPWRDDFAAARNRALEAATGDWILVLDADERLRPGAAAGLKKLVAEARADGYNVTIESPMRGDMATRFVGNYCRLFRRHPAVRFEGRVHEQVYPSLRRAGLSVAPSSLVIEHEGYALDPETMERKKKRNLAILEGEIAERPGDHFVQFNLGITYFALHDLGKAEAMLRSAVRQTDEVLSREILAIAHARLSQCALARGDREQSSRDAGNALACDPDQAIPRFVLATIGCHEQRFSDAAEEFRRILAAGELLSGDGLDRAEISRELGICLYKAEKFDEAAEAFATSALGRPGDGSVRLFMGNALAHAGHLEAAIDAYRDALAVDPEQTDARGNLETLAIEAGYRHFDEGRPKKALALVPPDTHNTELLFLKAVALHALKDLPGARRTLEELNSIDNGYAEAHWNLALICRALGDAPAARKALDRFRQLAPGDSRAAALEEAMGAVTPAGGHWPPEPGTA